jgi:NADPH2:quinone reductase
MRRSSARDDLFATRRKDAPNRSVKHVVNLVDFCGGRNEMRAIQIQQAGGPEVLVMRDIPTPVPAPGQVLIRVEACGVNFIDIYVREGRYGNVTPFVPGQEAAGTIAAVGEGVTTATVGDRVAWCSVLGTYAEYAIAPADRVVSLPSKLSFVDGAAAMLQGMTAHYLSRSAYSIQRGDEVLIHAGAGGVGLLLTQMAKSLGAHVTTTVSSDEKAALSQGAGADEVLLYSKLDFATELKSRGKYLKVIYDSVGSATFEPSLGCLQDRGTIVLYGTASGKVPPFDLERLAAGSFFVTRPILKHYTASRYELVQRSAEVFQAILDGSLHLRIEHTYPLDQASQAHKDLEGRQTTGKLVLLP